MLLAVINNKDQTLLLDIPYRRAELYEKLCGIGVWNPQGDIFIRERENESVGVKLSGSDALDNCLLGYFTENTTLATVNTVCEAVYALSAEQREQLTDGIMKNQYPDIKSLLGGVFAMKVQTPAKRNVNYYCPLKINTEDSDGFDMVEYGGNISAPTVNAIKALLFDEQNRGDPMIEYFNDDAALKAKLKFAVWDVEEKDGELYGVIRCRFKEPLTEAEEAVWRDWLVGQCSDGIGEGVEQRPVKADCDDLYVSFWNDSDDWSLMDESEFESYLMQEQQCDDMKM